ncbi:hypothetical protein EIP91_008546 [Steccherinum ochraceum]|uniref:MYND-type domain-containing protein n=1 Tax=Steccherinum ochraceum TaxID=92696 RepID=A0A4V2MV77_9APHY|nr:hypothetical protein EIP91_008546 [Steccherinum ochraceum]
MSSLKNIRVHATDVSLASEPSSIECSQCKFISIFDFVFTLHSNFDIILRQTHYGIKPADCPVRVYYCNSKHSKSDWPKHKEDCKPSTTSSELATAVQIHDAILFATKEPNPRMVKVPFKWIQEKPFLPSDTPPPAFQVLARNPWPTSNCPFWVGSLYPGGPPLPDNRLLVAFINDNFSVDGSPPNFCIGKFLGVKQWGDMPYRWADNVIVLRKRSVEDPEFQSAVWEEDLPILKQYWSKYTEND